MPYSYPDYKDEVRRHLAAKIAPVDRVLDVGPGSGTYSNLLADVTDLVDCLEIYETYVRMFHLEEKYHKVYIGDIRTFEVTSYKYIILGDVLEHLSTEDAQNLMARIGKIPCLVAVPYLFEQGPEFDNVHETHLQSDLTEAIMLERYPMLSVLYSNSRYGYFVNYE